MDDSGSNRERHRGDASSEGRPQGAEADEVRDGACVRGPCQRQRRCLPTKDVTRLRIVIAHVAALPLALVVAVVVAIRPFRSSPEAIDIELNDTFFVVAHFHASIVLGAFVLVATGVAYRYGAVAPADAGGRDKYR